MQKLVRTASTNGGCSSPSAEAVFASVSVAVAAGKGCVCTVGTAAAGKGSVSPVSASVAAGKGSVSTLAVIKGSDSAVDVSAVLVCVAVSLEWEAVVGVETAGVADEHTTSNESAAVGVVSAVAVGVVASFEWGAVVGVESAGETETIGAVDLGRESAVSVMSAAAVCVAVLSFECKVAVEMGVSAVAATVTADDIKGSDSGVNVTAAAVDAAVSFECKVDAAGETVSDGA